MTHEKSKPDFYGDPIDHTEVLFERPGAVMAFRIDTLHGTPTFAVKEVATTVSPTMKDAKVWAEQHISQGSHLVFVLGHEGWHLRAADSEMQFSAAQIESFFSQTLLQHLWLTHHPVASARERYFKVLMRKGIH